MTTAHHLIQQKHNFIQELDKAIQLLEGGFQLLQASDGVHFHRYTVLRLLSDGLERYLKLTLQAHEFNRTGEFLTKEKMKEAGHKLLKLKKKVDESCFSPDTTSQLAIQADITFVANDPVLNVLLGLLEGFAVEGRYYHLDGVAAPHDLDDGSPEDRWDDVIRATYDDEENWVSSVIDGDPNLVPRIIGSMERYLRYISRSIFLNDEMSSDVKSFASYMASSFLKITDEDFGQRTYPLFSRLD